MKKTILVIRKFDKFSEILAQAGFKIVNFQAIETLPAADSNDLDKKLERINEFAGLFFTSPTAAEIFLQRFREKNLKFGGKIYVLGNRTETLFEDTNFETVSRKKANTAEELINFFERREFAGKKFLYLRGDKSLRKIPELLKNVAEVEEAVVYKTVKSSIDQTLIDEIKEKLRRREIDWICFFSPSAIESFIGAVGEIEPNAANIAAIGKTTAAKAAEKFLNASFISPRANAEHFACGLIKRIKEIE